MKTAKTQLIPEIAAIALLLVLPLAGVALSGWTVERYLEFPPVTRYVEHAGFSWPVFIGLALLSLLVIAPFVVRVLFAHGATEVRHPQPQALAPALLPQNERKFPGWGWIGVVFGICAWVLAWSRFSCFAALQPFTFSSVWLGYIVTVNALTFRRTGRCMLTHRTRYFLLLFLASALFWWFFEYLNRFVQNWYYVDIGSLSPLQYFLFATLPFSTVLPAVMGTFDLLATFSRLYQGLGHAFNMSRFNPHRVASGVLLISIIGLAGIAMWPDYLFPLLWLAPLGVLASVQVLAGRTILFADLARGDWRRICLLALSALICGLFWEMWNYYSLARWEYAVPYVNRFHIFAMPVLGYAGYLPFGLECAIIADRVAAWCGHHS